MAQDKPFVCPRCRRRFGDEHGLAQHAKVKHGDRGMLRRGRDEEESLADIAVEAEIKRLTGEDLDPLEESLLP